MKLSHSKQPRGEPLLEQEESFGVALYVHAWGGLAGSRFVVVCSVSQVHMLVCVDRGTDACLCAPLAPAERDQTRGGNKHDQIQNKLLNASCVRID